MRTNVTVGSTRSLAQNVELATDATADADGAPVTQVDPEGEPGAADPISATSWLEGVEGVDGVDGVEGADALELTLLAGVSVAPTEASGGDEERPEQPATHTRENARTSAI